MSRMCPYEIVGLVAGECLYRCPQCGHERQSDKPASMLHRPCPKAPADTDPKGDDGHRPPPRSPCRKPSCDCNYSLALHLWQEAGGPVRALDQVDAILPVCQACEQWGQGRVVNKLRMATFTCPLNKW